MKKRSFKKILFLIVSILLLTCYISNNLNTFVKAEGSSEKYVLIGGDSIGLKIDTGVYVAGKYDVKTKNDKVSPWLYSNIEVGDKIIKYNDIPINEANDIIKILKVEKNDEAILTIKRNETSFKTKIEVLDTVNMTKSIGLYLKDKLLGVGTLTFIDPDSYAYGSLGHGIFDQKVLAGDVNGTITFSKVQSIKKGKTGEPGEKRASLETEKIGTIKYNTITGVYGKLNHNIKFSSKKKALVASQEDVMIGPAKIYTVVNGTDIEAFDVEITEIVKQNKRDVKGIKLKVTDQKLIQNTGGIVQGMSGSPIVQNGKLVGAVSHVTVDNPIFGYGIHICWMLEEVASKNY